MQLAAARLDFLSGACSESATMDTIGRHFKQHAYTYDPHTACGVSAVEQLRSKMVQACRLVATRQGEGHKVSH